MDVRLSKYRLSELLSRGDVRSDSDEVVQYGNPAKLAVFAANPFRRGVDPITRHVITVDGVVAGGEYCYPVEIVADEEVITCESGSETSVKEEYRKSAVGLEFLSNKGTEDESSQVSLGCGMAQRYARIHKMFGYSVFAMPRQMAVFCSRSIVEKYVSRHLVKVVSALLDVGLCLWWKMVSIRVCWRFRHCEIREVKPEEADMVVRISELVLSDGKRFRENHCPEWFHWHMTQTFKKEGPGRLYAVQEDGVVVAFFMTKRRFYAQASSRGFKNVMLGSVIEWGVRRGRENLLVPIMLEAAFRLRLENVDAVEVTTPEKSIIEGLRWNLFMPVGESNFGIRVGGKSRLAEVEGWDDPKNWRLRPAMCDNGL